MIGIPETEYSKTHGWSANKMAIEGLTPWIDIYAKDNDKGYIEICYYFNPDHVSFWENY